MNQSISVSSSKFTYFSDIYDAKEDVATSYYWGYFWQFIDMAISKAYSENLLICTAGLNIGCVDSGGNYTSCLLGHVR